MILCVGFTPCLQRTLHFSRFRPGAVNRASAVHLGTGGKAINAARTLVALGERPILFGFLGGDTGRTLAALLAEAGVTNDALPIGSPTRVCTTIIDHDSGRITELVEEAPPPADECWREVARRLENRLDTAEVAVASGTIPANWPDSVYADIASLAAAKGRSLIIDSHGTALLAALTHRPLLVKMNRSELQATAATGSFVTGRSVLETLGRIPRPDESWMLVTDGPHPAWLVQGRSKWRIVPPRIEAHSALGSGDAAAAGIASALRRGAPMPEAVRRGMACGAANATTFVPADFDAALVDRLAMEVAVEKVQ